MTNEAGAKSKIPPQFIDSNFLNIDGVRKLRIGSSLGFRGLFYLHPSQPVQSIEMDGIEIAFSSLMNIGDDGYVITTTSIPQLDDFVNYFSSSRSTLHNGTPTLKDYEQILYSMKSNHILKYFIYEVFEYMFATYSGVTKSFEFGDHPRRPSGFERKSLIEEVPNLTVARFAKMINHLLKQGDANTCIDFWKLYSLYYRINKRKGNRISEPNKVMRELLRKYNGIEIWSDDKGNLALFAGDKFRREIIAHGLFGMRLTKKVVDRQGLAHLRNSQRSFLRLYRRYVRAMSSILSFTNCAGKRTRTAKLFTPDVKFSHIQKSELIKNKRFQIPLDSMNPSSMKKAIKDHDKKFFNKIRKYWDLTEIKKYNESERDSNSVKIDLLAYQKMNEMELDEKAEIKFYEANFNDISDLHLNEGKSVIPMIISGDAGMGKTTVMAQCSLSYFSKLENKLDGFLSSGEDMSSLPLPVVLKAKRYSNVRDNRLDYPVFDDNLLPHFMIDSNPELLKHLTLEEITNLVSIWQQMKNMHHSSMVYFIDGVDECGSKNDATEMFEKIKSSSELSSEKPVLIISTRPSHDDVVTNSLPKYSICEMKKGIGEFYSESELSLKMPIMLCDAWGLTRESGEKLSEIFSTYNYILSNPMNVGWFCYLILEDELGKIENSNVVAISQNNLIGKIIEIGIEKSLERRESPFSDAVAKEQEDADFFRNLLKMFVSVAFHYTLSKPTDVFTKMKQLGFVESVSNEVRNSIKNDCGILFLADHNIVWTHTTFAEIIYSDFFFNNHLAINLGPIRVTEPVISRTAQLHFENGDFDSYISAELNMRHKLLPIQDFVEFVKFELWESHIESSNINKTPILCVFDGKLVPIHDVPLTDTELEVANIYVRSLGTRTQFPISKDYIQPNDLNDALVLIYEHSNNPFCTDLLRPIHSENILEINQINPAKISSDTKLADCFAYYRNLLLNHTDKNLSPEHPVLQIHKRASNFEGIFDIRYVNAMTNYEIDDILNTWIENYEPDDWYEERESLITHITTEYVFTAFEKLFGKGNDETCTDMIYDTLQDTNVHLLMDSANGVVESVNILTWLLGKHGLNGFIDLDRSGVPAEILYQYDMNELIERQLVIVPFVHEC